MTQGDVKHVLAGTADAAPAAPLRRRRWWFRPLALLLSLAVSFALGEGIIRILYGAPLIEREPVLMVQANPHTGWMMLPDTPHYMYHHRVAVNALGLRGPQVSPKMHDELRVLALGDSMVYGQGVGDEQTLPTQLQWALGRRIGWWAEGVSSTGGRTATVINGGLRGFSTNQELGLLRDVGPRIEPDIVVLFWYWNDVVEHDIAEVNRNLSIAGPVAFDTKTRLEGRERTKWRLRQIPRRSALLMWLHDVFRRSDERLIESEIALGLRRLRTYLGEFKAMSDEHGFAFMVAIVPDPNQLRGPHQSRAVDDRAAAVCEAAGVPVLRLIEAARSADGGGLRLPVVPYDGHYNAEANRAMAEAVAAEVLRRFDRGKPPKSRWRVEKAP